MFKCLISLALLSSLTLNALPVLPAQAGHIPDSVLSLPMPELVQGPGLLSEIRFQSQTELEIRQSFLPGQALMRGSKVFSTLDDIQMWLGIFFLGLVAAGGGLLGSQIGTNLSAGNPDVRRSNESIGALIGAITFPLAVWGAWTIYKMQAETARDEELRQLKEEWDKELEDWEKNKPFKARELVSADLCWQIVEF